MDKIEAKRIINWVGWCSVVGFVTSFTPLLCLLAIPALPGGLIGGLIAGEPIITDHGADMKWLLPANTLCYAYIGLMVGVYINRNKRNQNKIPKCSKCGYCLVGNRSARCPECGTEFDPTILWKKEFDSFDDL